MHDSSRKLSGFDRPTRSLEKVQCKISHLAQRAVKVIHRHLSKSTLSDRIRANRWKIKISNAPSAGLRHRNFATLENALFAESHEHRPDAGIRKLPGEVIFDLLDPR